MFKPTVLAVAAAFLFLCTGAAQAELYQYVDQNGVVHYTDNYAAIPEQYRPQATVSPEAPAEPQDRQAAGSTPTPDDPGRVTDETGGKEQTEASDKNRNARQQEWEQLVERKKQLDQTYESLLEEKAALDARSKKISKEDEIKAYNQEVKQVNEKIRQYREKEKALRSDIDQYNERIRQE